MLVRAIMAYTTDQISRAFGQFGDGKGELSPAEFKAIFTRPVAGKKAVLNEEDVDRLLTMVATGRLGDRARGKRRHSTVPLPPPPQTVRARTDSALSTSSGAPPDRAGTLQWTRDACRDVCALRSPRLFGCMHLAAAPPLRAPQSLQSEEWE